MFMEGASWKQNNWTQRFYTVSLDFQALHKAWKLSFDRLSQSE